MNDHVVTGYIHKANRRQRISHELPLDEAETLKAKTEREMSIATSANKWVSDVQIEEVN